MDCYKNIWADVQQFSPEFSIAWAILLMFLRILLLIYFFIFLIRFLSIDAEKFSVFKVICKLCHALGGEVRLKNLWQSKPELVGLKKVDSDSIIFWRPDSSGGASKVESYQLETQERGGRGFKKVFFSMP